MIGAPGRRRQKRGQPCRRGLSLLEMLLAIGLGLLLLGGIYSAMDQSARQASIGRVEMERIQMARAVLRRIELDLRAAMFSPATASSDATASSGSTVSSSSSSSSSSGGGSSGTGSETAATTETIGSTEENPWTGSLGIRGNANEVWIDLSHIQRNLEFTDVVDLSASDLQTVAYFLTNSDTEIETDPDAVIVRTDEDGIGLARSQGDRSVLRTMNASLGSGVMPGNTAVLAPEINQLQFRYYDGLAWFEEWDSSTSGALPRAVEVVIGFEPPVDTGGYLATSAVSADSRTYRLVVAIPVSDPLPAEETY